MSRRVFLTPIYGALLLGAFLAIGYSPPAAAFYPFGSVNSNGAIVYWRWPLSYLDANHDGDVSGPTDGIELTLESGTNGWYADEVPVVHSAFSTWQNVPTTYAAFHYGPSVSIPLETDLGPDVAAIDLYNYIAVSTSGEAGMQLPTGVLGITLPTFILEDTWLTINGQMVNVTGGQILECDIVMSGPYHRPSATNATPLADLKSTLVHEIGHMLGLAHTPLQNLAAVGNEYAEKRVVAQRNVFGALTRVGATPTMFPFQFFVDLGNGTLADTGQGDLAPDDIAGVSFMYPRGSQDSFFTVSAEARTHTRVGYPSQEIPGANIVAWCDLDNDPATPRVPLYSTMTGLYEVFNPNGGLFAMRGLTKQLETLNGVTIQANYTFTCSALDGTDVTGYPPENFFSTHMMPDISGITNDFTFNTNFPAETFREGGNLSEVATHDQGTALTYDATNKRVISVSSGKSLEVLLAAGRPMFGSPNDICPLNVVTAGLSPNQGPTKLRGLRDSLLANSAIGVALVEAYYRVSPTIAHFLLQHTSAWGAARMMARAVEWTISHATVITIVTLSLAGIALAGWRRRRTMATHVARVPRVILLLLIACGLSASPAFGRLLMMTTHETVKASQDIVVGKVTSVDSHFTADQRRIVTDVTITLSDTVKGLLNKDGVLRLQLPGGQVGPVITYVTDLPAFIPGEEVVVFLENPSSEVGYLVVGGARGKFEIHTSPTGKKSVQASSIAAEKALADAIAAIKKSLSGESEPAEPKAAASTEAPSGKAEIPLADFKKYLRDIVKAQDKEESGK